MKSQYAGECYISNGGCGAKWKQGDDINPNGLKNSKGKDAWCIYGSQCINHRSASNQTQQSAEPVKPATTDESKILFAQSAVTGFIATCIANGLEAEGVRDQVGSVFNTAIMNYKR